jgi:hypothetical protein
MTKPSSVDHMFETQTHVMTEDLLNALDILVDFRGSPNLEMATWFERFLTATDEGEEFTVTAEQADWIIANAQETFDSYELEDGEEADSSDLDLIIETFDDYANFVRLGQSDNGLEDIFRVVTKDGTDN